MHTLFLFSLYIACFYMSRYTSFCACLKNLASVAGRPYHFRQSDAFGVRCPFFHRITCKMQFIARFWQRENDPNQSPELDAFCKESVSKAVCQNALAAIWYCRPFAGRNRRRFSFKKDGLKRIIDHSLHFSLNFQ